MTRKANEPRATLRVPVSFRDYVYEEAKKYGMDATKFLEGKKVVSNG